MSEKKNAGMLGLKVTTSLRLLCRFAPRNDSVKVLPGSHAPAWEPIWLVCIPTLEHGNE